MQIRERVEREDIATFPAALDAYDLDWPDEDCSAFLDVAIRCGCRLLYVETHAVSQDELDAITRHFDHAVDQPSPELRAALKSATRHIGEPSRIELGHIAACPTGGWSRQPGWRSWTTR